MAVSGGLEPTEESARAINALEYDETGLSEMLARMGQRIREIVPEIWGLSVSVNDGDVTFTLVASSPEVAALDGVQYSTGGPCVAAVAEQREVRIEQIDSPMVESEWQLFASASAAAGVGSTLSFPLSHQGQVLGGVNLYASSPEAFVGHEAELAAICGAEAGQGVSNADMSFASRRRAEHGPERIAEQNEIEMAVGVLMVRRALEAGPARNELEEAARRAGVGQVSIARAILSALPGDH